MVNVALTHDRRCTCRAARPPAVLICSIFIRVESSLIDRARGERKVGAKILNFDLPTDFRPENRNVCCAISTSSAGRRGSNYCLQIGELAFDTFIGGACTGVRFMRKRSLPVLSECFPIAGRMANRARMQHGRSLMLNSIRYIFGPNNFAISRDRERFCVTRFFLRCFSTFLSR